MKQIFLDVETKKTFEEVGGFFPEKLEASFIGIIERDGFPEDPDVREARYELFEKDFKKLPPILEHADIIIGFNITGFDLPTLQPLYPGDNMKLPQLDLLDNIKNKAGHRVSLNAVAKETLGVQKIGHGLDAITYYQNHKANGHTGHDLMSLKLMRLRQH